MHDDTFGAKGHVLDELGRAGELVLRRVADVEAVPIRWLWPGRIARGKITVIAGHPGLGKSQITCALAAVVTRGLRWPVDDTPCEAGCVAMLSAEDDVADTIRPRLEAAGADVQRVEVLDGVIEAFASDGAPLQRSLNLRDDIAKLDALCAARPDLALLIADPISAYLGATDSHVNAEVRALLAPLSALAAKYGVAVVLVSHLNKGSGTDALARVTGSLAFVAAARGAFIVAKDPENERRRLFLTAKTNLAQDIGGLAFAVESYTLPSGIETSRILWEPGTVSITADEAMAAPSDPAERSELDDAKAFLIGLLEGGPVPTRQIQKDAEGAGHAWRTVRRAQQALGIEARKVGLREGWVWELPPKMPIHPRHEILDTFEKIGRLRIRPENIEDVQDSCGGGDGHLRDSEAYRRARDGSDGL